MCRYCSHLQQLRRDDVARFERSKQIYRRWWKEDMMLLRECLIALDWRKNKDLAERICKVLEGGDIDVA